MKLDTTTSPNLIDRRAGAAAVGIFAAILAVFGFHRSRAADPDRDLVELVSTALDRGQAFWGSRIGAGYRTAHVVLYEASTSSACGRALASSGPFYCPGDQRIYVDLAFVKAIPGALARAYVIAHELGHHVQRMRGALDPARPSVVVELEADCYAGAWMADEHRLGHLEDGDLAAAIAEAAAVGDDRLCPSCSPERWTHGSAAQRDAALMRGVDRGECL